MTELIGEILAMVFGGLLGRARRGEPEARPMLELCPVFVLRKPTWRIVKNCVWMAITGVVLGVVMALVEGDILLLAWFLIVTAVALAVYVGVDLRRRVKVTEEALTVRRLIGTDTIPWRHIVLTRVIRTVNVRTVDIALRDHMGDEVLRTDTDDPNAWYLVRMAEEKGIEIREEMQSRT